MAGRGRSNGKRPDPDETYEAIDRFTFQVALLFFRMQTAATQYLGQGRHSSGRRSLLKSLAEGPQTVPEMARRRSVSRQHIQVLVNTLRADGLATTRVNPADRRSRLVTLTGKGRRFLEGLRSREVILFAELADGIPIDDLVKATELVQEMRSRLEGEEWERRLTRPSGP